MALATQGILRGSSSRRILALMLATVAGPAMAAQPTATPQASAAEPQPANAAPPEAAAANSAEGSTGEAIIVTGSRLANGFSAPTPVSVVGAARLEQRGVPSIADALNEVPAFRASNTPQSGELAPNAGYVGGRILDLRGLGAVRTLTLVDDKRFVPATTQFTVDTNMIPSILLDRAEVVTGGASAQYGSDAVSGVANLILNHKLIGIKATAQDSITKYGDNNDALLGLAGGFQIGDNLHLVIGGEYENDRGVGDCQARPFCRTETLNFGRNPFTAGNTPTRPANNILPNIRPSTVPFNGVTVPPASAYNNRDFPVLRAIDGITFAADGTPSRFQYGAISNNLYMQGGQGQGENIYFKYLNLVAPTERYAITGNLDWNVTPDIQASLMVNYGHLKSEYSAITYRNAALTIQADNPFIPRSADPTLDIPTILAASGLTSFQLGKGFNELGRVPYITHDEVGRVVASIGGKIAGSWSFDAYYQYGHNSFRDDITNNTITANITKALDAVRNGAGQIVCRVNADASTANDDPNCVAYNPFGQQASAAAKAYVTGDGFQTNKDTENVVSGNVRGNLFNLPYGPVAIAAGAEYRSDDVSGNTDPLSQSLAFFSGNGSRISGKIEVEEAYGEGEVPILADLSFANELSLNGAIRRTHYKRTSDFFPSSSLSVTTWKYGGIYEPIPAIRFRATWSRDIRAPNVAELFGPTTLASGILTDPANSQQTVVNIIGGSNPNLKPETGDTFTTGIVLKPTGGFLGRFRASIDYYNIRIKDAISTLGQQNIATRCFQGDPQSCAQITRGPIPPGQTVGPILQVVDTFQNVNKLINRGFDGELDYRQPLGDAGDLEFRLLATYVKDFITIDAVGPTQRAGQTGLRGGTPPGLPDWVFDGLVSWTHDAFTLNAHGRYINKGFYNAAFVGPDQDGYSQPASNSTSTNDVPSRFYLDLLAQYRVGASTAHQMTFYVGVDNLTDADPPLNPGSHGTGNDIIFSPVGRTYKAGVRISY